MPVVHVRIMPKASILDPQGKAITKALHSLGFEAVADARQGKLIKLDVPQVNEADIRKMCETLLVNTLTEDYTLELDNAA